MFEDFESVDFMPEGLAVGRISLVGNAVVISAVSSAESAACPDCKGMSRSLHSLYDRRLSDLPSHGRRVSILLTARRFLCGTPECAKRTFAERLEAAAVPAYGRRTGRLQELVVRVGQALGGRPGARLAKRLLFGVSKDVLLRSVCAQAQPDAGDDLRVIGIDDWAWRRGQRYGTLICDLERRRTVDLLPDRDPATVEAWLKRHPQIEIVARDRNGGYAGAISRALPDAIQVADRWHLLANVGDAFLSAVRASMPAIRRAVGAKVIDPALLTQAERIQYEGFLRRRETNDQVRQMQEEGLSLKQIAAMSGLCKQVVRQILRGEREDVFRRRQSILDPWLAFLDRHWENGCRNGAELWRRLKAEGFRGGLRVVGEWAARRRRAEQAQATGSGKCPSARRIACMMTFGRDDLSRQETLTIAQIEAALPDLVTVRNLTDRFVNMVRNRDHGALKPWLLEAEKTELRSFVNGLRADQNAVEAALAQQWSNGQTEGQINKLKTLKRQMYGRAGIDLLRARMIAVP